MSDKRGETCKLKVATLMQLGKNVDRSTTKEAQSNKL